MPLLGMDPKISLSRGEELSILPSVQTLLFFNRVRWQFKRTRHLSLYNWKGIIGSQDGSGKEDINWKMNFSENLQMAGWAYPSFPFGN